MAQPVWVLSVDLQTKTATFQSGMAEAAKSARGAFTDIKTGSAEMGREVGGNMMEARHGVMLLGEEFGVHLPRALTTFIAGIGPVGAAMEAAFPFLAVAVGATLLIEALVKIHEAGEKVTEDQVKFGTALQTAFNSLDEKILQAGIRADDLRNNHLGALTKQLELIDKQSMAELVHEFGEVAKAADTVFGDLKSHWFTFGVGADGAKHAMEAFQTQYDSLLAQGKDKEASNLLSGTTAQAERVLDLYKQIADEHSKWQEGSPKMDLNLSELQQKTGRYSYTAKEIAAQETLVAALKAQLGIEQQVATLKKADSANTGRSAAGAMAGEASAKAREAAESALRMGSSAVAADKSVAEAQLAVKRASVAEKLALDLDFSNREYAVQLAGNAQLIAALDKLAKDYPNQLKALQDKALELTQTHANQMAVLTAKAAVEQAGKDLQTLEQSEREKIDATQKASSERLGIINAAIKAEQSLGLQDTNFYRELLTMRVETTRQMTEESAKLAAEAGRESAENGQKMGELGLAAVKQHMALINSFRRVSAQQQIDQETRFANEEYDIKIRAFAREEAALNTSGTDYANKLRELQNKETQLRKAHANEVTEIEEKAEEQRNSRILSAENQRNEAIARGLTNVLMRHQSFASMMGTLGDQVASGMIQNAIKSMLADDMTKERDAAAAARKMFNAGAQFPFPANIVMAPAMGAMAFAAVMAFNSGTDAVPGVGRGDSVPTLLTPGEGVVPGGVMDNLRTMARNGTMGGGGHTYHVHVSPTYHVQTIDGDGMQATLDKHTDQLQRHFEGALRRMNK